MIGLLNAYKNYDKSKDVKFSTYAFSYILGEISKYVREDKSIKISKDMVRLGSKIQEYIDKHKKVRGYKPTIKEISNMLKIDESKVVLALDSLLGVKSLDSNINSYEDLTLLDVTASVDLDDKEQLIDLKNAFDYLDNSEKNLIINRYYKDLTQSEIADSMGVNQVYVSRLEKKVLKKMKSKMTN